MTKNSCVSSSSNCFQVESSRQANVRDGIDYPETVHNFLSNRPVELIMMTLQVTNNYV